MTKQSHMLPVNYYFNLDFHSIYFFFVLFFVPKVDGHFIYLQIEGSINSGMQSKFTSNIINPDGDICLTFWYHMYVQNPDTLRVYTESGNTTQLRWSQNGSHLNQWNFASFTITKSEPYRIIFEGVRGSSGYWSVVAIDDISLLDRSCSGKKINQKDILEAVPF